MPQGAVDCGGGRSCAAGHVCVRGGVECLTPAELADRTEAEKWQKEQDAAARAQAVADLKAKETERREALRENLGKKLKDAVDQLVKAKTTERAATDKMKEHIAEALRDVNERDKYLAQQKTITELTYKAQVISIYQKEMGVAAVKSAFLFVPIVGEYTGAVTIGGKTTLTYFAGKEAVKTLVENGLDKVLESKGYIRPDENQNIVVRLLSPVAGYAGQSVGYPLQVIFKRADLEYAKQQVGR
jgi:hypothetical protein